MYLGKSAFQIVSIVSTVSLDVCVLLHNAQKDVAG